MLVSNVNSSTNMQMIFLVRHVLNSFVANEILHNMHYYPFIFMSALFPLQRCQSPCEVTINFTFNKKCPYFRIFSLKNPGFGLNFRQQPTQGLSFIQNLDFLSRFWTLFDRLQTRQLSNIRNPDQIGVRIITVQPLKYGKGNIYYTKSHCLGKQCGQK